MSEYGAAARYGEHAAEGIIARAAKDVLRDAEGAAGRAAAGDAARSETRSATSKITLKMKSMLDRYRGEHTGDPSAPFGGTVRYLDDGEREAYRLTAQDGRLLDADGVPFDTSAAATVHTGGGRAIYVMDGEGNIYASTYQRIGDFHHSSFLGGKDVAGAGELVVRDGRLEGISLRSGHYQPTPEMQAQVLRVLESKGIDISRVVEEGW